MHHLRKLANNKRNWPGWFITFEGGEGSGKSTLLRTLTSELQLRHLPVVATREPGGVPIAEQIRQVILDQSAVDMDQITEAMLYAAARRQHLIQKIIPALEQAQIVLCDRYIDSSMAYQAGARGLGKEMVKAINQFAIQGYYPDRTYLIDLDPEEGLQRREADTEASLNRLDLEKMMFHQQVREAYLHLAADEPSRICVLDGRQTPEELVHAVIQDLTALQVI